MALGIEVSLGPDYIVPDWDLAPLHKRGRSSPSQFSAQFYCGQTAGCIKMSLGMEVCLSPGEFVLDGDTDPSPKGGGARPSLILRVEVENCEISHFRL